MDRHMYINVCTYAYRHIVCVRERKGEIFCLKEEHFVFYYFEIEMIL